MELSQFVLNKCSENLVYSSMLYHLFIRTICLCCIIVFHETILKSVSKYYQIILVYFVYFNCEFEKRQSKIKSPQKIQKNLFTNKRGLVVKSVPFEKLKKKQKRTVEMSHQDKKRTRSHLSTARLHTVKIHSEKDSVGKQAILTHSYNKRGLVKCPI